MLDGSEINKLINYGGDGGQFSYPVSYFLNAIELKLKKNPFVDPFNFDIYIEKNQTNDN
ncbi:MAG: hypothetical protein R2771_13615 [Saprospiraceae bacterium]